MKVRAALVEALVRLSLLVVAGALLRWATVTLRDWLEDFNATLERTWGGWFASLALVAAAGFLVGLAALAGRPRGYRILIPLVIALPPLVLLGHYYLVIENAVSNGDDLPWILGHYFFYMEPAAQYVLALVVGFGVASGLQPAARQS
ncbi:MAG TPA: hypothetical protein VEV43_08410 [Actinomycetota bacterium]|nr:hypothetical protein [Actinomycetota bacterium]